MGSEEGQENELPVHRVWVDNFAITKYPVTNCEYVRFVEATGHRQPEGWKESRFTHPNQPVVAVSWFDAVAYCTWFSHITGSPYRLPTEAEWEKASRGGIEGQRFPWGNDLPDWMDPYCRDHMVEQPDVVGQDPANEYGAHNMGDLVHEWCKDWYASDYYKNSPDRNPQGPTTGVRRASRSGSWRHSIKVTRCAARSSIRPNRTLTDYGFRVAMSR